MKKIALVSLAMTFLMGCTTTAINKSVDVQTLFSSKSNAENKVWVGTFQLAFNDMKNNIIKKDIKFVGETPTDDLIGLNKAEFNKEMLNESSYYTSYGETKPSAKEKIKKDIKEKFDTTSEILDTVDWSEGVGKYYAYAMLKKQFDFLEKFDILEDGSFNSSEAKFAYFGITDNSKAELDKNISVLFHNDKNDYAVRLMTTNGDQVYLYRTDKDNSFDELYKEMIQGANNYTGNHKFSEIDTFKAPKIKIKTDRKYPELCNKQIEGTDYIFTDAIETLELELDEAGGKVKSEALLMMKTNALFPMEDKVEPRHFDFDKTFVLFLVDSGKQDPYLALRIKDMNLFKK